MIFKKRSPIFLLGILFLFAHCEQSPNKPVVDDDEPDVPSVPDVPDAIALWSRSGLRDSPSAQGKFIVNLFLGEGMYLTGKSEEAPAEKRTYVEVQLSDGKKGWINEYLIARDAEPGAVMNPLEVYRRPEITTFTGKSFQPGELIALKKTDNADWYQVEGEEKKLTGFVRRGIGVSTEEADVQLVVLLSRAKAETDKTKREALLKSILGNMEMASSPIIHLVQAALEGPERPPLPPNQLYIEADKVNIRSQPAVEGSSVLFQLAAGDVCEILEKGDLAAVNGKEDHWYFISNKGNTGWVFGALTSKRLAP